MVIMSYAMCIVKPLPNGGPHVIYIHIPMLESYPSPNGNLPPKYIVIQYIYTYV